MGKFLRNQVCINYDDISNSTSDICSAVIIIQSFKEFVCSESQLTAIY